MREALIEQYLVQRVKKLGGEAYKFSSPNRRNVPDRFCLFPGRTACFIECKATGKKPTPAQLREINRLAKLGFYVFWIDSKKDVDQVLLALLGYSSLPV